MMCLPAANEFSEMAYQSTACNQLYIGQEKQGDKYKSSL